MARTKDQIMREIEGCQLRSDQHEDQGYYADQDSAHNHGMLQGFKYALGINSDLLSDLANRVGKGYVSIGDDLEDAYQAGYELAIKWAAGHFDWDENGNAVFVDIEKQKK